jgi:hypothetical protein
VDRQFLPRWTLANYYFRRGNVNMFWHWTREASAMVYGDARPVFRLCARVAEDGNLIDRLPIRNPEVRAAYLAYLLEQNRVDLIGPAVQRLLEENRENDVPLLLTACDRFLDVRRVDGAAGIWNRQAAAGRLPFPTPAGAGEQFIVNGSFLAPPASRGFDWRLPAVEGISASREERPPGLRITFSGREPEDCEALAQLVPLRMRTAYDLSFGYRTREIPRGVGLGWRITDASSGAILKEGPSLASESEGEGRLSFETPGECSLVRLALRYRRTPGTTRLEGYLVLRNLELKPSAQLPIEGSRVRK